MTRDWMAVMADIATPLAEAGFDIIAPCNVGHYQQLAPDGWKLKAGDDDNLLVVIGNHKRLWQQFLEACKQEHWDQWDNPIDAYTEDAALKLAKLVPPEQTLFSHKDKIDMRGAALAAGIGWRGECGLVIHPVFGPWISLRFVMTFSVSGPKRVSIPSQSCDCTQGCGDTSPEKMSWRHHRALRRACPVGRDFEFDPLQLEYHYTHDKTLIEKAASS